MPTSVYKKDEYVGCSPTSLTDAINNAIAVAARSGPQVGWFEVQELRGNIQDGKVSQYQVVLKVGHKIDG
jgi:hypothetical protein